MTALKNATAVITGAGSGIGRASAHAMAARGARVVVADIDGDAAERVAEEIASSGGQAAAVVCDVTAEHAHAELGEFAVDRFGRVDVVMNNVGVLTSGRPDHLPVSEWQRIIDTNLMSVVRSNAVFLPVLMRQGRGHIVNTASFAGLFSYSYDRLPYAATKAAIVQMSEGLRLYLQPRGIGVTVVCPGPVATNILSSMPPTFGPPVKTGLPGEQSRFLRRKWSARRSSMRSSTTHSWSSHTRRSSKCWWTALRTGKGFWPGRSLHSGTDRSNRCRSGQP
ncbi:SDR family oxidoreductase [Mycolicibacterium rutilum]|uniref:SDR family oxidoreductase n=1 Tax=Mycolicibacterium rutilum TaxID=370526 RepID=UPI000A5FA79A|nr:SDR family oxidoreductase [Mycolicibacterium rutilum]